MGFYWATEKIVGFYLGDSRRKWAEKRSELMNGEKGRNKREKWYNYLRHRGYPTRPHHYIIKILKGLQWGIPHENFKMGRQNYKNCKNYVKISAKRNKMTNIFLPPT